MTADNTTCEYCGKPLPVRKGPTGPKQLWCSDWPCGKKGRLRREVIADLRRQGIIPA